MADYITNSVSTIFGDAKIKFGTGTSNTLIDSDILNKNMNINYSYKLMSDDMSDQLSFSMSRANNFTQAIIDFIVDKIGIFEVDGQPIFIGIVQRTSIIKDYKTNTININILAFDYANALYTGGGSRVDMTTYLTNIFTNLGYAFTFEEIGEPKFVLSDGTNVYIDNTKATGSDKYIEVSVTNQTIKATLLLMMCEFIFIKDYAYLSTKTRTGIATSSFPSDLYKHTEVPFFKNTSYSKNYKVVCMNYLTSSLSTFFEMYSNDVITNNIDKLNGYRSIGDIDSSNWTISSHALVTSGGFNYYNDFNGYRIMWVTSPTDNAIKPITLKLSSSYYNTIATGNKLLVNFFVFAHHDIFDVSFKLTNSQEKILERSVTNFGGYNYSSEYIVDGTVASDDIEITLLPNLETLVKLERGLFVTAVNYFGESLIVTTSVDPASIGVVVGSEMFCYNIGDLYIGYTYGPVTGVTSSTITFTIGLYQPFPFLQENASVWFRDVIFGLSPSYLPVLSDISIGIDDDTTTIDLTGGVTNVSQCPDIYTNGYPSQKKSDLDLVYRMMDRALDAGYKLNGSPTQQTKKKINYTSRTDELFKTGSRVYDVIVKDSVNYKQIDHTIDLNTGLINVEMIEI